MKRFLDWIINRFTYIQIYAVICSLFFISLFPIAFFWVIGHQQLIARLDSQLSALSEEKILTKIFSLIEEHRMLSLKHSIEPQNKDISEQMQVIQNQVNQYFEALGNATFFAEHHEVTSEILLWEQIFPREILEKWQEIISEGSTITQRENESLHTLLLHDITTLFNYLASRAGISYYEAQLDRYIFVQSIFFTIPAFQEDISQLLLISQKILTNSSKELSRDRAQALVDLIKSDINYFQKIFSIYAKGSQALNLDHEKTAKYLKDYIDAVSHFVQIVQSEVLMASGPTIDLAGFSKETQNILPIGMQVWDQGLNTTKTIFENERTLVIGRLWIILFITFILTSFAFILGFALIYTGILRLSQLTQATNNFTNGDLSVRVPDTYQDEIGTQAQAFNRMAQKLEELITNLFQLIDVISELSNGNLKVRIPIRDDNSEFDQVALSFNKMAATFETIIGRPKQIGLMLTTSASEIAAASKEQETIVVEQEATTREIAIAAKEISSTAKEFANTMNEVSQAAEQTSSLALRGKDSLNNMESIMRNMVDASTKIATKLAILNEKAGNITSVVTTITKVADQTNLLSLNASIEAEKAGEYGRSFAVIAREIRRLADQSAIATLDIEKMINEIMAAVSSSVMGVDDFTQEIRKGGEQVGFVSQQLATIIEQVQAFTSRFDIVNQGMQAQSTGAEQINEAIAQLSLTARQTSEAIHQFHKTVQELNHAANELSILNPFAKPSINGAQSPP